MCRKPCYGSHTVTPGGVPNTNIVCNVPRLPNSSAIYWGGQSIWTLAWASSFSLGRDHPSPKTNMPRLGGEFKHNPSSIEFSPRRGSLAWARYSFTQYRASRLSEMLKHNLPTLTGSRLGEAHSPKLDDLSPKARILHLSETLEQSQCSSLC